MQYVLDSAAVKQKNGRYDQNQADSPFSRCVAMLELTVENNYNLDMLFSRDDETVRGETGDDCSSVLGRLCRLNRLESTRVDAKRDGFKWNRYEERAEFGRVKMQGFAPASRSSFLWEK